MRQLSSQTSVISHAVDGRRLRRLAKATGEVALLFGVMTALQGCVLLDPPDTFGDMELRLDEITPWLPDSYIQLASSRYGGRIAFAGPPPEVIRVFGGTWSEGAMCETVEELARLFVDVRWLDDDRCNFVVSIGSGWRARIVGVWSYYLGVTATGPVSESDAEKLCEWSRKDQDRVKMHGEHEWSDYCLINPGDGKFRVSVMGK